VAIAERVGGATAALRAALIMSVMPLAAAGLVLATPDAPLLAATAVAIYCLVRALESPVGSSVSLRWWIATGAALGLAFSSKYTSILLPVAVVVAVVVRRDLRERLREPGPYVACVVAALVFIPVLAWNARHGWISFVFQLRHGLSAPQGSALVAAWKHEGDFFGGQAALASPILFIMMAIAVGAGARRGATAVRFTLAMLALVSFAFFIYSAVRQRVEPNWPAPAYIPAIVLIATASWSERGFKWLKAGGALAALMSVIIYAQALAPILPIKPSKDPIARAFGWPEVANAARDAANIADGAAGSTTWFGGDRYQEASELAFQDALHRPTFALNLSGRMNQYDLWPRFSDARAGDNLTCPRRRPDLHATIRALTPYFLSCDTRGASDAETRRWRDRRASRLELSAGGGGPNGPPEGPGLARHPEGAGAQRLPPRVILREPERSGRRPKDRSAPRLFLALLTLFHTVPRPHPFQKLQ
jgi:undecaprenyl-diphosphatase